jgi:hypothetical protein
MGEWYPGKFIEKFLGGKASTQAGGREEIVTKITEARVDVTYAEDYARAGDYEGAHRHISRAHQRLREASRLMGFRPE